jgi:perosamine synthetase
MINIYNPDISKYSSSAIKAINSGWISNLGENINLAKDKLKEIIRSNYVLLTSNGTTATHCLFMSLKYKYPNIKKIYVPNNVYVAVWNCVLMEYNIECIKVLKTDINTFNFNLNQLDNLEYGACLVIVHNVGNIIDTDYIHSKRPDLILVEDNCEGIFGKINGKFTGNCKNVLASSCSFYGNKTITTGEGGAFFTNDEDIYKYISKKINQGNTNKRYVHDLLGYNYRMTNIQAGFLYDQLNDIENILEKKRKVFNTYDILFKDLINDGKIIVPIGSNNCERACWIYTIRIKGIKFEKISEFLKNENIDTRPFFYPIHIHDHLKDLKIDDLNSDILSNECMMIPSSPNLTNEEQVYIVNKIKEYFNSLPLQDSK